EGGNLKLANLVTLSRAVLILPVLGILVAGHRGLALAVYVVAACTDLVDGWLARRSGRASAFGAQLDAAVDNVFSIAILIFLAIAFPGLISRHPIAFWALAVAPLAYLAISWLLKRRLLMFHFWSAKVGAFLLFALWPAMAITGWEGWLPLTAAVVTLSRAEQILLILRGGLDLEAAHGFVSLSPPVSERP
ncbi:MAG: CDP-alcohol phosphatidyltransferase, partial [Brevundimonas sp.]|nr:CDP-alcohol phosphatidyltransferase [Brevundimonas sp.]